MAKSLKLRLSRVIPSFQLCRSKNPCSFSDSLVPVTRKPSPFKPKSMDIFYSRLQAPPPSTTPENNINHDYSHSKPEKKKLLSVNKTRRNEADYSEEFSYNDKKERMGFTMDKTNEDKKTNDKKGKADHVLSEGEDDTSCEFSQSMASSSSEEPNGICNEDNINMNKMRHVPVLKRLPACSLDGKVREGVAVVKKSEDPYEDFKRSMLEMIMWRQLFEGQDLEELLLCFLSLNSRHYHEVIVEAFSDIWEFLFCDSG